MSTEPQRVHTPSVSAIVQGGGEPVLLLHGIGGNAHTFDEVGALLAPTHLAIAWDAPGYGASPDPVKPPGVNGYLAAVTDLLSFVGGSAHIVGTSWGGVIATCLATTYPTAVRTLTLLDSTRGSAVDPSRAAAMRRRPDELADVGAAEFARRRARRLPAPGAPAKMVEGVQHLMSQVRVPGYRGAAQFMADADTGPLLGSISAPTLVAVGEHDHITGVAESRLLAGRITGARLEIVPNAGHTAVQEQPRVIANLLLGFFQEAKTGKALA